MRTNKGTSTSETMVKKIYKVVCTSIIVDSKGNEKTFLSKNKGFFKSKDDAELNRDVWYYALKTAYKKNAQSFKFNNKEFSMITYLDNVGFVNVDDANAKLKLKYEVMEENLEAYPVSSARKVLYNVVCTSTIVDSTNNERLTIGHFNFGLYNTKREASCKCKDCYFTTQYGFKKDEKLSLYEFNDNEFSFATDLSNKGFIYLGDQNAKMELKYEVEEVKLS